MIAPEIRETKNPSSDLEHTHQAVRDMVTGDEVCVRCGLVIQERIFDHTKNSQLGQESDTTEADLSTGLDITQHDLGLGSTFDMPNDGGISPEYRATLRRMRRLNAQARVKSWHERTLRYSMFELDRLCERLSLPKGVQAEIAYWYRKAKAARLTFGRDRKLVLAALAYIVCVQKGVARTGAELVAAVGSTTDSGLANVIRLINDKLKLGPRQAAKSKDPVGFLVEWYGLQWIEKDAKRLMARSRVSPRIRGSQVRRAKKAIKAAADVNYDDRSQYLKRLLVKNVGKLDEGTADYCRRVIRGDRIGSCGG